MPPTGAETKVQDPEYKNWLRVSLALFYLKDALHTFIQGEVDAMHQSLLQKLYGGSFVPKPHCSSCKSKDVKQNRNTYVWKLRSPCPSGLCDVWLKELLTLHTNPTSNKISWENCDVTAWPFVPWECAKLYMPRGQPAASTGLVMSDSQALLTLIANCKYIHGKLSPAGLTLTHTVSTIRNRVMHSGNMNLSDNDRKSFVQDIIHLLEDPTHLVLLEECKRAVNEINRINNDSVDVIFNLDLEMKALRECVNDCRQELGILKKDTEVTMESLKDEFTKLKDQFDNSVKDTKDNVRDLDAKCQCIDTSMTKLSKNVKRQVRMLRRKVDTDQGQHEKKLRKLDKAIQKVKASTSQSTGHISESGINKLRDDLIKAYQNLRCVQVSPIFEMSRRDIDNIYVDLVIEEKQESKNTEEESKYVTQHKNAQPHSKEPIKVTSYKQVFLDEKGLKFKRVYLRGKGGLGKTTFCRKVLHDWCNAHENRVTAQDSLFQDKAVLKTFDLLFYMNLREVSLEENLIEVICTQFPLEEIPNQNVLGTLLKANGDKVLFILDGLDEMIVKPKFLENVVTRRVYPNCCFLVSSRPWKISHMELQEGTEIDLLLDVKGFSKENVRKCAKKIFKICYKDGNVIENFMEDIEGNKLAMQLIHVPLLLLFLAQVWYENKRSLPSKLHELYILFLNLLTDRVKEKYRKDPNHRQTRFTLGDMQSPLPSKISETSLVVNFGEGLLLSLCEVAHHFLLRSQKENSLVFEETKLLNVLGDRGEEKLNIALDLGVLSVTDSVSYLNRKTNVSFLHKTMQEFFTALCLILSPDKLSNFVSSMADLNDVLQNENIIIFFVGLMPELGNHVLEKVNDLCRDDWETNSEGLEMYRYRVCDISNIYVGCEREVIGHDVQLNVSGLYLIQNYFNLQYWNPDFLQYLEITGFSSILFGIEYVLLDLKGLRQLRYLKIRELPCNLYLPESGSLSTLIIYKTALSSSCCDVLGGSLKHCNKLKNLQICGTNLYNCLLDLSNMKELNVLHMSCVRLSSSCCDELGRTLTQCTKLMVLSMYGTDFHDCLLDLSNMTELTALDISEVILSCSCCDVLGNTLIHCPKLQRLSITETNLHNCLLDLSNMTELTVLYMLKVILSSTCCDVLGSTMKHCTKLDRLGIYYTNLHNTHLDLSNMTELSVLHISNVKLSGSCDILGSTLAHCTSLKKIKICKTDLHNSVLDLSNMTELTVLNMSLVTLSSSCCDVLGSSLTHCKKLKELKINNTDLHNCLLDLSNMTELTILDISEITLSSSCCDVLGRTLTHCTKLETFTISSTDLHNCMLDLSNMTELSDLDMRGVSISSSCCDILGSTLTHCTKMMRFTICKEDLHSCMLDLSKLTELTSLYISEVILSCSCCDVLGNTLIHCPKLHSLAITKTNLHNCLLDLSKITELTDLNISEVTLSSSCCDVLGRTLTHCTKLKTLRVHMTDLHNCLLDLSNMRELTKVDISKATLSSSCCDVLSSTIAHCTKCEILKIRYTDIHNGVFDLSNMDAVLHLEFKGVIMSSTALPSFCHINRRLTFQHSQCDNDKWKVNLFDEDINSSGSEMYFSESDFASLNDLYQ